MKLKLICSMLLLFIAAQSCKKAVELKNQLVDAYWKNVDGVVLQFSDTGAYVIDAGNSNLESNPSVFDINSMPYIKNLVQTGTSSYTGDIIKTSSLSGKITSVKYESTSINLSEENGKLVIRLSNSDAGANSWTANADAGGGTSTTTPAVPRDTTTSMLKDATGTFKVVTSTGGASSFTNFPVYSRYRRLSNSATGAYYYRMDVYPNPNSPWLMTLYFKEKPTATKVYNVVSGSMASMIGVGTDNIGIEWNSYMEAASGQTASVTVSGGKITVTATDIKTESNTAVYDDYLTFKVIGQ